MRPVSSAHAGAVRLSYDSVAKVVHTYYDDDLSNGHQIWPTCKDMKWCPTSESSTVHAESPFLLVQAPWPQRSGTRI